MFSQSAGNFNAGGTAGNGYNARQQQVQEIGTV
jgi:hypothetical protein